MNAITLSLPEFDVLWHEARGGVTPYPLDVPHHGATPAARAALVAEVRADLTRRGLVRRGRVEPDLEVALSVLASPERSVTVMGLADVTAGELVRALVGTRGAYAVLAVRHEDGVTVDVLHDRTPVTAALGVLPPRGAGPGRRVTVPAAALDPGGTPAVVRRVRAGDDDLRALRGMLAGPIVGTGHVSVGRAAVTWIDTPGGRYAADGADWVTVAPADGPTLAGRVRALWGEPRSAR
ncbi:ESX secretion-associated protein EspG [Actinosynnema sp. NPDC020468]|uniref:ESX secretion-associated protein EspG n=1 Tax=Actinosynnema sp. NPDC020468 TaxID=3154488 RepID=UPI0033D1916D